MTKASIHQENLTIPKAYISSNRALKHLKWKLTDQQGEIHKSVIVQTFHHPSLNSWKTRRRKMSKNTEDLYYTPNQLDTIDIFRTIHPIIAGYTIFLKCTENVYHAARKPTSTFHPLQLWAAEAKCMVSADLRLGAPFLLPVSSPGVEAAPQV